MHIYPWHREEKTQTTNGQMTARKQLKYKSNQLSFPLGYDYKPRKTLSTALQNKDQTPPHTKYFSKTVL